MIDVEHSIEFMTAKLNEGVGYELDTDTYTMRNAEWLGMHVDKTRLTGSFLFGCRDIEHRKAQAEHDKQHREKTGFTEL